MKPWNDRAGRLSPLKAVTFAAAFVPGLVMLWWLATGGAGPRPFDTITHETGEWTVRFLLLSLAVTPFRRIYNWPRLIMVRRMVGLTALAYALAHLGTYIADQNLDLVRVATEIASRVYLTIGFVAILGLAVLGATSTDGAIRRLGRNWTRIHRAVYVIAGLGLLHYFMQAKLDVFRPTLYVGIFVLLMLYRVLHARGFKLTPVILLGAAVIATAATMGIEVAWFGSATGVPADRVFLANFQLNTMIRPSWWVGVIGCAVALTAAFRLGIDRFRPSPSGRRAPAE